MSERDEIQQLVDEFARSHGYSKRSGSWYRTLEHTLGSEAADALMDHLPPVTWNQVATEDDLDKLATRAEMQVGFAELRGEMHVGFAELRGEMQGLRTEFVEAANRQLKWLDTFAAAWSSLLVAAARLLP